MAVVRLCWYANPVFRIMRNRTMSSLSSHLVQAERLVGYPTAILGLKDLLGDELAYMASLFKRLLGSKHPVVNTAREVFLGKEASSMHIHGLVVLLVSKLLNCCIPGVQNKPFCTDSSGILDSQRSLAEITEVIHAAHLVHHSLLDLPEGMFSTEEAKDLEFGNKISILCGDLLLAKSSVALANLRTPKVVEYVSQGIADMMTGTACLMNRSNLTQGDYQMWDPQPAKSSNFHYNQSRSKAAHYHSSSSQSSHFSPFYLMYGSLLAHSCKSAAILSGVDIGFQNTIHSFAGNLALANKVSGIIARSSRLCDASSFEPSKDSEDGVYNEAAQRLHSACTNKALEELRNFPDCEARNVLEDIVFSLQDSIQPYLTISDS